MALALCPKSPSRLQTQQSKSTPQPLKTSAEYAEKTEFRSSSTTNQESLSTDPSVRGDTNWWINNWAWINDYKPDPTGLETMHYFEICKRIRNKSLDPLIEIQGITGPLSAWRALFNEALQKVYYEPKHASS